MFFAIVAKFDLHCHQMDVETAFLNVDLYQDVYIEQPEGFVYPKRPDFVCKLQKALYVLEIDISEMRSQDTCNTHVCKLSHSTHMYFV